MLTNTEWLNPGAFDVWWTAAAKDCLWFRKHFLHILLDKTKAHANVECVVWRREVAAGENQEEKEGGRQRELLYTLTRGLPRTKNTFQTHDSFVRPEQALQCTKYTLIQNPPPVHTQAHAFLFSV